MKILFSDLELSPATLPIVNDGWLPAAEVSSIGEPEGLIEASLTGSGEALVRGRLEHRISVSCGRCCAPVELDTAVEFSYVCVVGSEEYDAELNEFECREEDYNKLYLKEPVIDVGDLLREQLLLNIPPRVLCGKSCQGLCQICGVDLNTDRCDCEQRQVDSPFAVLRRLKGR